MTRVHTVADWDRWWSAPVDLSSEFVYARIRLSLPEFLTLGVERYLEVEADGQVVWELRIHRRVGHEGSVPCEAPVDGSDVDGSLRTTVRPASDAGLSHSVSPASEATGGAS